MPFVIKITVLTGFALIAFIFAIEIILLLDFLRCNRKPDKPKSKLFSRPAIVVHVIVLAGMLCLFYGFFVEPYWLQVNHIPITTNKLGGVKLRIVQISDLHCDTKMRNEEKVVELINAAEPDVVVFTGDGVNPHGSVELFRKTLAGIEAKIAKIAVEGNWDKPPGKCKYFDGTGFEILDRETLRLEKDGKEFCISGLSFWKNAGSDQLLSANSPDTFNVLLNHSPDLIEDVAKFNIDLYLAGHTHGGQIALPFYGALITFSKFGKKYEAGLYRVGKTDMYVNRGVGMEGGRAPRARFLARPEIAIFDIVGED